MIVFRHEVLRSTVSTVEGKPVQHVHPENRLFIPLIDLSCLTREQRKAELSRLMDVEAHKSISLEEGPLVRASLLRLSPEEHVLIISIHHIVMDGWSVEILASEMAALYTAFAEGKPSPLSELPIQYADFAQWQNEWMDGGRIEKELSYWREQLAGAPPALDLPTDRSRPAVQTTRGARRHFALSSAIKSTSGSVRKPKLLPVVIMSVL